MRETDALLRELKTITSEIKTFIYYNVPVKKGQTHVWESYFKILGNNYHSNFKSKINESLFIRQLKPTLTVNEKSIPLHLFN